MQTKIHHYYFDISKPEEAKQYLELVKKIKADHPEARGRRMKAIPCPRTRSTTGTEIIEIDPTYIFEDQWNTYGGIVAEIGWRVFDWYEVMLFYNDDKENKTAKYGHWVEITDEMAELRMSTKKCGYCGTLYGPSYITTLPANGFCDRCLDSPYLKEKDLHLLRLIPLTTKNTFAPLTDEERADLTPKFVYRQTTATNSRAVTERNKQREEVMKKYEKEKISITEERDGMLMLWELGIDLANVIYYSHIRKFCLGWRTSNGLDKSVADKLREKLVYFPFSYYIKE